MTKSNNETTAPEETLDNWLSQIEETEDIKVVEGRKRGRPRKTQPVEPATKDYGETIETVLRAISTGLQTGEPKQEEIDAGKQMLNPLANKYFDSLSETQPEALGLVFAVIFLTPRFFQMWARIRNERQSAKGVTVPATERTQEEF